MVRQPSSDRALASWLFWSANPADLIFGSGELNDGLIGAILRRSKEGGFQTSRLHYWRVEVALSAIRIAQALAKPEGPPPFTIPRELCASFEGNNASLPSFDEATENALSQVFRNLGGKLPRSDEESLDWKRTGGNWWYETALQLPAQPQTHEDMTSIALIDAVFGEHRATLARIEDARSKSAGSRRDTVGQNRVSQTSPTGVDTNHGQPLIGLAILSVSALILAIILVANLIG